MLIQLCGHFVVIDLNDIVKGKSTETTRKVQLSHKEQSVETASDYCLKAEKKGTMLSGAFCLISISNKNSHNHKDCIGSLSLKDVCVYQ